jgi:uncharacterized protein (TIRG00374 family)
MLKTHRRLFYWLVALLLAGVLLYFSLRGIQWPEVWRVLSRAKPAYLAAAIAISSGALLLRALRWRVLLRAEGPVDVAGAFWATSAGYFGNNFLPARAGELVRTLMISSRYRLSKMFVLTTALSERVSDAIVLVAIATLVLLGLRVKPGWFQHAATPFAVIGCCGILAIALLPKLEKYWERLLKSAPLPLPLREKLLVLLGQLLIGMRTFHDARRLLSFVTLTLVIWFCDAATVILAMRALGLEIGLPVVFLLITGLALGSALPSTPGYVGIYQFVSVSVLTPFGFSKVDSVAYSFLGQALQYALITFWGLLALTRRRAWKVKEATDELPA